jgi:hypothetical protein
MEQWEEEQEERKMSQMLPLYGSLVDPRNRSEVRRPSPVPVASPSDLKPQVVSNLKLYVVGHGWVETKADNTLEDCETSELLQTARRGLYPQPTPVPQPNGKQEEAPSKACFVAGTPLLTPGGVRAIEAFRVGDTILSRDEWDVGGEASVQYVEEVFVATGLVVNITAGGQTIGTTAEHPLWVVGKGWTAAQELQAGDVLVGHDQQRVAVVRVRVTGELATVYNLRVSNHHTYFVGRDEWGFSVWAHNACITLYQEPSGNYHDKLRHWAVYVESDKGNLAGDTTNDKGNEPQGKERMNVEAWEAWGRDNKIKIWFRTFPNPKMGMIASKPMEITEEDAAKAIQLKKDMADEKSVKWSLNGESCFEFVARVLRAAKPKVEIPASPNGSEKRRDQLLEALADIMNK